MSQEFLITIKTKADLEAAKQLKAQLEQQIAQNKELGKEFETLTSKLKALEQALQAEAAKTAEATEAAEKATEAAKEQAAATEKAAEAAEKKATAQAKAKEASKQAQAAAKENTKQQQALEGELRKLLGHIPGVERLWSVLSAFGGGAAAMAAAGVGALAAAFLGLTKAIQQYAGAQTNVAKLDAALAQNGLLIEDYRQKLQALAGALQDDTGIAGDTWISVLARLTQFGGDPSNINKYVAAVKNLAGIVGDVNTAGDMIAKALQGSFEAFTRYGIVVDDAGTRTEKLDKLFAQLAQRGGGQLEAMNKTLSGQFKGLSNAFGDFTQAIGQGVASTGVLQTVTYGLTKTLSWMASVISSTIPKLDGMTNSARQAGRGFYDSEAAAKKFADHLKEIETNAEKSQRAIDRLKHAINEQVRAAIALIDSELAEKLDNISVLEKLGPGRGGISSDTANRARRAVQREADIKKFQVEQERDKDLIDFEQAKITEAKQERDKVQAQIAADKSTLAKVKALEAARANLAATQQQFDEQSASADIDIKSVSSDAAIRALGWLPLPGADVAINSAPPDVARQLADLQQLEMRLDQMREDALETQKAVPGENRSSVQIQDEIKAREAELILRQKAYEDRAAQGGQTIEDLQRAMRVRQITVPRQIRSQDRLTQAESIVNRAEEKKTRDEALQKQIVDAAKSGLPAPSPATNGKEEQLGKQLAAEIIQGDNHTVSMIEKLLDAVQHGHARTNRLEATIDTLLQQSKNTGRQIKNNLLQ